MADYPAEVVTMQQESAGQETTVFPRWTGTDDLSGDGPGSTDESRRDYIRELLKVSGEDARTVRLFVAFSIAIVTLTVKDIGLAGLRIPFATLAVIGLLLLLASAGIFFWYAGRVDYHRMAIARCLASSDARRARAWWTGAAGVRAQSRRWLITGKGCFFGGMVALMPALISQLLT
jgi:hypothetical protein